MRRLAASLLLLQLMGSCRESRSTADARTELHVSLPDGWRALTSPAGLQVGPSDHVVLLLESQSWPMPSLDELMAALALEKVVVSQKDVTESYIWVRYELGEQQGGLLGVRSLGTRTVWCSSTREASASDLDLARAVCRDLALEPTR